MTRLEQQLRFIIEVDKVKEIFVRLIWQMEAGKRMMQSIPGIWRLWLCCFGNMRRNGQIWFG